MPRQATNAFILEKNKKLNKPIHLFTIHDYDGLGTNLYFAEYPSNVSYDSITYVAFPITFDSIKENSQGTVGTVTLQISDVTRVIAAYVASYNFQGKKVTIKTVWYDLLLDTLSFIDDVYYVDTYSYDQHISSFVLTSKFSALNVELPLRKYSRDYCMWIFKGTECAYAGAATSCNKTKAACKALSNYDRFGGFPSINPKRAILA